jgi:hypothetical protein
MIAFCGSPASGGVHQDLPHQPRSHGHEMGAILQIIGLLVHKPQVGFMNKSRALECVVLTFRPQVVMSQPAKFPVNQRHKVIQCALVAVSPLPQKLGNLVGYQYGQVRLRAGCRPSDGNDISAHSVSQWGYVTNEAVILGELVGMRSCGVFSGSWSPRVAALIVVLTHSN